MATFVALGLVILSGFLLASLQLPLGTLLLLYGSSLGAHVRSKTKNLVSSYIAGATLMNFLLLAAGCFLISALTSIKTSALDSPLFAFLLFLVTLLYSFFILCFYYRPTSSWLPESLTRNFSALGVKTRSTELWLPRRLAKFLNSRAKLASSNPEAFSLGIMTVVSELPFSFLLFLYAALGLLGLDPLFEIPALVLFTLLSVLPLLLLRFAIHNGKNLADVQRWRLRHKPFFRLFSGLGFFILALFFFAFVILGGGA